VFRTARHWSHLLSQMYPVHTSPKPTYFRSTSTLFSHLCLGLQSGPFRSDFPTNILYAFLSSLCYTILYYTKEYATYFRRNFVTKTFTNPNKSQSAQSKETVPLAVQARTCAHTTSSQVTKCPPARAKLTLRFSKIHTSNKNFLLLSKSLFVSHIEWRTYIKIMTTKRTPVKCLCTDGYPSLQQKASASLFGSTYHLRPSSGIYEMKHMNTIKPAYR